MAEKERYPRETGFFIKTAIENRQTPYWNFREEMSHDW